MRHKRRSELREGQRCGDVRPWRDQGNPGQRRASSRRMVVCALRCTATFAQPRSSIPWRVLHNPAPVLRPQPRHPWSTTATRAGRARSGARPRPPKGSHRQPGPHQQGDLAQPWWWPPKETHRLRWCRVLPSSPLSNQGNLGQPGERALALAPGRARQPWSTTVTRTETCPVPSATKGATTATRANMPLSNEGSLGQPRRLAPRRARSPRVLRPLHRPPSSNRRRCAWGLPTKTTLVNHGDFSYESLLSSSLSSTKATLVAAPEDGYPFPRWDDEV